MRDLQPTQDFVDSGVALPWALEEHHLAWQEVVRSFVRKRVEPDAGPRSIAGRFDPGLSLEAGHLGLFGLLVPEEYGGMGADLRTLCLTLEEMATVDVSLASVIHVQSVGGAFLAFLARHRPDLRDILPAAARGESFISFGLTEPSVGSDAANLRTRAVRDGSDWVITGSKQFISNSGTEFSRYMIVFAATGVTESGRPGISTFLVPLDNPGVSVGAGYDKFGWRAADTHPVHLEDVRLPADALLGTEGDGLRNALSFLTWARIPVSAVGTGIVRGCLRDALNFVKDREVFGRPLAAFQNTAFQLAELASRASTSRMLTYDAAWKHDHDLPFDREAANAKLVTSEMANEAAYIATQLQGGYGVVGDGIAARAYQDARILTIVEGTSEVQRLLIARSLGLPDGP